VSHVLSILFGAAFTVAVMWAMGRLLFRRLAIRLSAVEHDLLAFITGGALLSFVVFILCAINAARTPVFLVLGIAALALNWRFGTGATGRLPRLPLPWTFLFAAPFAIYALLYLSNSLAPEASPDGQAYHLGLVYRFFREHGFHRLTTNMYSNLPLGLEMLFLFAFSFGRHSAAATVHCCYLLALPILMLSYARRIERPGVGVCAAMMVYLSPIVGIDGISAYNDVALATTAFALFYLLEIWRAEQNDTNDRLLIPIGLLAGFCVAIKLTGFVAPLYAAAVILMRKRPGALVPVTAAAAMIALPWLIKDWIWLGNPVSPFLNRVFPNPWIHVQFEESYRAYFRHYELTSFRQWPWSVTTGGQLGGQVGPLFLVAPIALLALRTRTGRHCLLAALFFLIPYPQNIGARFLIPALPFVALAVPLVILSPAFSVLLIAAAAVLGWPAMIEKYQAPASGWHIAQMQWPAALRIVPQDVFLRNHSAAWVGAQTLDYFVPKGKRVWSSTPVGEAWCSTNVMINYQSAEGELIEDILSTAVSDQASTLNLRFTFPKRRLQHLRISQTATSPDDIWSIGEVLIFDGPEQIPRGPSWKLNADPYPWDIGLAFDSNPVTRWRSWESVHPRMHVDVDFGVPTEIDRVELHSSHDQGKIEVQLDVPAKLDKLEDLPAGDLRRVATETVKARGIDYLFIDNPYRIAADIRQDPARWGMEFIADRGGNRLYRIQ
jgi:hypothetical protein